MQALYHEGFDRGYQHRSANLFPHVTVREVEEYSGFFTQLKVTILQFTITQL